MCLSCFDKEWPKFISNLEFESFSMELKRKMNLNCIGRFVGKEKVPEFRFLGFIDFGVKEIAEIGFEVYQCKVCSQNWKLSLPDYAWRGFFVKIDTVPELTPSE